VLPHAAMRAFGTDEEVHALADELVRNRLWETHARGYVIHDFLSYNLSSKEAERERKAARSRMRAFRKCSDVVRANTSRTRRRTNAFVPDGTGRESSPASSGEEGECEGKKPTPDAQARGLIELVNTTAGTHFQPVAANLKFVRARLAEFDDWTLAAMVLRQWATWKLKPEMRPYFRPATLFNAEKCAQYVGLLTDTDRAWIQRKQTQGAAA
jgi:uncharacterized phage protein (TIGR02220 family)